MTNGLQKWLVSNGWSLFMAVLAFIVAYTLLSAKVDANAEKVSKLEILVEKVIILEEHDKSIVDDIVEIKLDIKEINKTLKIR